MADTDKHPLDLALDALVYVPVGLAVSAREMLPQLAAKGRQLLDGQVHTARMMGRFAVQQGQSQATAAFNRACAETRERMEADEPAPGEAPAATVAPPGDGAASVVTTGAAADTLAIPGYDSLSASQVLPRLAGLSAEELESVRAYEAAHRARSTILGKISQLQTTT